MNRDSTKERYKLAYQGWFYAIQRIDILIISISGAGVYLNLETLKYAFENHISCYRSLKVSGVSFVLSVIVNIISQFTGKKSNVNDMHYCEAILEASEPPSKVEESLINKYDKEAEKFSKVTEILNLFSFLLMLIGLTTLVYYFLLTF